MLTRFYGIYFGKMLAQKRRGIRTRHIGRRKEKGIHAVERLMAIVTGLIVPVPPVCIAVDRNYCPAGARFTGFWLEPVGDALFLSAVLSMKGGWRAAFRTKTTPTL